MSGIIVEMWVRQPDPCSTLLFGDYDIIENSQTNTTAAKAKIFTTPRSAHSLLSILCFSLGVGYPGGTSYGSGYLFVYLFIYKFKK